MCQDSQSPVWQHAREVCVAVAASEPFVTVEVHHHGYHGIKVGSALMPSERKRERGRE